MNNLDILSFNYNKVVNNFTNQDVVKHKIDMLGHKMKQTSIKPFCSFYKEFAELELAICKSDEQMCFIDLEMYLKWLGSNGVSGN